jgi:hypothetical protein
VTKAFLTVNVENVVGLSDRLSRLTGSEIAAITVPVLNEVATRTYDMARDRITTTINLSDDYLRKRFRVDKATERNPKAVITALGGKENATPLGRYGPVKMVLIPKKDKRNRGQGKLPLNGMRQRAVTIEVTKGKPLSLLYAFAQPLRAGNVDGGNGLGVFTRIKGKTGKKDYTHRYGPQVYQMFRTQIGNIEDDVLDDMEQSLLVAADNAIAKVLE